MVACFGLHDGYQLPRFPFNRLIESRARLDATMLNRVGALVDGAVTELRWGDIPCQLARRAPNLLINGNPVLVVWTDHALPWFECPRCARRCRHIFLDELACRTCLRLDYACRHVARSVHGLHKLKQLRRRIGVSEQPFSPLPKRPLPHTRYNRIADEIRALERGLVAHLGSINETLQRRIRVRKSKGKW